MVPRQWQGPRAPPHTESEEGHSSTVTSSCTTTKTSHAFLFPTFLGQEAGVVHCGRLTSTENTFLGSAVPMDTCSF